MKKKGLERASQSWRKWSKNIPPCNEVGKLLSLHYKRVVDAERSNIRSKLTRSDRLRRVSRNSAKKGENMNEADREKGKMDVRIHEDG